MQNKKRDDTQQTTSNAAIPIHMSMTLHSIDQSRGPLFAAFASGPAAPGHPHPIITPTVCQGLSPGPPARRPDQTAAGVETEARGRSGAAKIVDASAIGLRNARVWFK